MEHTRKAIYEEIRQDVKLLLGWNFLVLKSLLMTSENVDGFPLGDYTSH